MKKIRILSLDGGGIRGILSGTILTYLEEQIRRKTNNEKASIGEYFDLVAGTSTGGILCLVFLCPDDNGNYMFTAREALDIYLDQGDEIFDVSLHKKIKSLGGLRDEKYEAYELEEALLAYLGEKQLSELLRPCLITSYDIRNRKAHFFTSIDATKSAIYDYYLRDVARATSAAPTYFEPVRIKSIYGTPYALIDGGVFANNPALCAYAEARNIAFSEALNDPEKPDKPGAKNMIIVSIGTGEVKEPYHYKEFQDAGVLKWINPLIDIMMSGNSETVDYQLKQIYETLPKRDCEDYYRIQPKIIHANNAMDNATLNNLKALHEDGLASVEFYKEQLDEIVEKLVANH
ncbi:patatin-like phospholipase family protein [Autumnicola psychrophila]|uniref:Patatin-like phospholipase family protein n=1 Tax=Autumnicola psychrophila TaxID=3075592 RepID=A0ABU3DVK0_9FLAO|nr:patatin-like phospholipase family protein [Zunongwangia sp. F225]MDT0687755.1 patatin-like phospholipase family protein [Zunongwangia sp. F225]